MTRINEHARGDAELALATLSWILRSKRPLKSSELQYALAIEPDESNFDSDNLMDVAEALSLCAGLVTVDQETEVVRLVHYTTQEYLDRNRALWLPLADSNIAKACLSYLSCGLSLPDDSGLSTKTKNKIETIPLLTYTARHWGDHVSDVEKDVGELEHDLSLAISLLLQNEILFDTYTEACCSSDEPETAMVQEYFFRASCAHIAAFFDLALYLEYLLTAGINLDGRNGYGLTPLNVAANFGNQAAVNLLLWTAKVDPNTFDQLGNTPLFRAAELGHSATVANLLAAGSHVNYQDPDGQTALSLAVQCGHGEVVKVILSTDDSSVEYGDCVGKTPWLHATERGWENICELLLGTTKVEVDERDRVGRTALLWAARRGHIQMVRFLYDVAGAGAEVEDEFKRTPLSYAAEYGHLAVAKFLLEIAGVYPKPDEGRGCTPLWYAFGKGSKAMATLLNAAKNSALNSRVRTILSPSAADSAILKSPTSTNAVKVCLRDPVRSGRAHEVIPRSDYDFWEQILTSSKINVNAINHR